MRKILLFVCLMLVACDADYSNRQYSFIVKDAEGACADRGGVKWVMSTDRYSNGAIYYKVQCADDKTLVTKTMEWKEY